MGASDALKWTGEDPALNETPRPRMRLAELMNLAGLLTVARGPLAFAFLWVADKPVPGLVVYLLGVGTDVIDGLVARRTGTTSYTGAMIDGYMDKLLHAVVALALVWHGRMPAWWLLLWFSREWILLVMVASFWGAYSRGEFKPRGANRLGKNTTVALSLALVSTMLEWSGPALALTLVTGALGLATGLTYLRQVLEDRGARR